MFGSWIERQAFVRACGFIGACAGLYVVYLLVTMTSGRAHGPEPWVSKPSGEWPQIVLDTTARFDGHSSLSRQTACLVELDDGEIVAATARFTLTGQGSVHPRLRLDELRIKLAEWTFQRPDSDDVALRAVGLFGEPESYRKSYLDVLLLEIEPPEDELPVTPLKIYGGMPPRDGTTLYFVTGSRTRGQRIHTGYVVESGMGLVRCRLGPKSSRRSTRTRPGIGTPVVNSRGHIVGLVAGEEEGPDGETGIFAVHSVRLLLRKL